MENKYDFKKWPRFIDELPLWSAPFGLKLLDYIDYRPNISAIDIGFGTGFPLIEIALRLGNNSTVYGIDPWKECVERTRLKIDFYGIENIKIIEDIAESIPLKNNFLDLITSNNCINNVESIEKACLNFMKQWNKHYLN
jgi:ubiquinone/menaquinone biosynthesis C-methylase UbiE